MKILMAAAVFFLFITGNVRAQEAAMDKKGLILKFIDVFGTKTVLTQNLEAMFKDLGADDPQAKKIKENIKVDEIIELLVPIYDKQFSEEDLHAFIDFYSSPPGRKLLTGIPVIMRESVEASTKYFQEKFPEAGQNAIPPDQIKE